MKTNSIFIDKINKIWLMVLTWIGRAFNILTLGFIFDMIFPKHRNWGLRKTTFVFCIMFLFIKHTMPWILKTTTGLDLTH